MANAPVDSTKDLKIIFRSFMIFSQKIENNKQKLVREKFFDLKSIFNGNVGQLSDM